MPITVKTSGPLFARPTSRIIAQSFREIGDRHAPEFVKLLKASARADRGDFRDSISYRFSGSGINTRLVLFADAPNAPFVEKGRKPGKQPPLEPTGEVITRGPRAGQERMQSILTGWVERRGFGSSIQERRAIAFAIGRRIGQRGIKGQYLFRDFRENHAAAVEAMYGELEERIARLFNED